MDRFTPGQLTPRDVIRLNEMWEAHKGLKRMTGGGAVSVRHTGGTPALSVDVRNHLLAEVVEDDAADPPVYTVRVLTRDRNTDVNEVIEDAPERLVTQVLSPTGQAFVEDDLVHLVPVVGHPGWFWALDAGRSGFFARLTTASGGLWKFVRLTLDVGGAEADDGVESVEFSASPLTIDGTDFFTDPVAGMRVWMIPSKETGFYEFMPIGLEIVDETAVSGPGWIYGLSFDRCLTLTVLSTSGACTGVSSGQEILLIGDAVDSWNSGVGDDFTYDTGSGPVELTRSAGMPHLTIDGIELGYDGSGTDADGYRYLDFVGAGSDFCDGTDPTGECDLSYVKVRVTCSECPDACCPEVAAPDEIHLTLTSVECPAFDRVVTLTRVFSYWYAGKVWYAPVAGVAGKWWQVQCNEGAADYELLITNTDPSGVDVPSLCASALVLTTDTCSPLHLTATALHTGFNPLVTCLGLTCPNPSNLAFDIVE